MARCMQLHSFNHANVHIFAFFHHAPVSMYIFWHFLYISKYGRGGADYLSNGFSFSHTSAYFCNSFALLPCLIIVLGTLNNV